MPEGQRGKGDTHDEPVKEATQQARAVARAAAVVPLSEDTKQQVVEKKVTCPFLGSAVATGALEVLNDAQNPLARIEDVRALGNSGGGDLGELLVLFATGNHACMRASTGKLDEPAPEGFFSLELPGSQGSHPGHSGILQGDPRMLDSGRLSMAELDRLLGRAKDGMLRRFDVGRFIGENLHRDPGSKVFGGSVAGLLARDLAQFAESIGSLVLTDVHGDDARRAATQTATLERFTKLLGENNLVGSAGEFGLLFAFFSHQAGAREVDDEPALPVADVRRMFVEKQFPVGWQTWKKTRLDWVTHTRALLVSAGREYLRLKRAGPD